MYYVSLCIPYMQGLYPEEDQIMKLLWSFAVTIAAAVIAHFVRVSFDYFLADFFLRNAKMQNDKELSANYGKKALDNTFKLLYHAGMVVYGGYVIWNTDCHHTWLGGKIDDRNLLQAFVNVGPDDFAIYIYCLVAHGYHLACLLQHLVYGDPYNSDYEKLMLHHIATNVMMIVGNYTGHHRWSAVILLLHDAVDVFVSISRIFNSLEGTKMLAVYLGYIPLIFIYAYLKLFYFGWLCYANWFLSTYPPERAWMQKFMNCHAFFNTSLWVLHIIWYK